MQKRLKMTLGNLEERHSIQMKELNQTLAAIETAKQSLEVLRQTYQTSSEQYIFFQEVRDYVTDLCDCLAEKVRPFLPFANALLGSHDRGL